MHICPFVPQVRLRRAFVHFRPSTLTSIKNNPSLHFPKKESFQSRKQGRRKKAPDWSPVQFVSVCGGQRAPLGPSSLLRCDHFGHEADDGGGGLRGVQFSEKMAHVISGAALLTRHEAKDFG